MAKDLQGRLAPRGRGIALITVLAMSAVVLMMVLGLYLSLRGGLFATVEHRRSVAASYVAEAGLAQTLELLEANALTPPSNPLSGSLPAGGTWEVMFNESGAPYSALESVNNLHSDVPAETYRGPDSLPPRAALIVVRATVEGVERVLEAIIVRAGSGLQVNDALHSGAELSLAGDVRIDGITALDDNAPVDGNVHSNSGGNPAVNWDGLGSISIAGEVKAVGTVNLGAYESSANITEGASPTSVTSLDVVGTVAAKTGATPAVFAGTSTTLAGGDHYYSGGTVYGDIVLDGANLYVNGPLTVEGSITGTGTVYVAGDTEVFGSASITGDPDKNIAIIASGDVTLKGYNGAAYLEALALSDPNVATWWSEGQSYAQQVNLLLGSHSMADLLNGEDTPLKQQMSGLLDGLGKVDAGWPTPGQKNVLKKLHDRLASEPPGPTRDFVMQRLDWVADFYTYGSAFGGDAQVITNFNDSNGDQVGGLLDAAGDTGTASLYPTVINISNSIGYDGLGSAQFQGLIYSAGDLVIENELTLVGAAVAQGTMQLDNSVRVTYVQDFFDDPAGVGGSAGNSLTIETWVGR